ncbi:hypothetical protein B0T17DRAFT_497656 [Bombardia bombarda]|uniref:Uncharacterized protein n=1 Tax=Bombardia bombarda TaxID=252184 RepID=A0AA40BV86_9PEZI|nr:hypothetical protein B0T17DRAFT_497656 [Bombardia bombarda]
MAGRDAELRILTPIGMLGYSFKEDLFWEAIEEGVDAVILDSGSTDSGPSRLALGTPGVTREGYENDLRILVAACHHHNTPLLIGACPSCMHSLHITAIKLTAKTGSAGGDGTNAHVDFIVDIIASIITSQSYRSMKVVTITADIPHATVTSKFKSGLISPCSSAVPPVQQRDIDDAPVIVAQMGYEPWLKAMKEHPDFDIIIGGRSYDPSPYAAFCVYKGFADLGPAYHMGKIMECGAVCALPKSAEALAIVRHDGSFDVRPLAPTARCTPLSVAAHTLYEKTRPDLLAGPGGVLDVTDASYEQLKDGRTTRVRGSKFRPLPEGKYTVKLEAARVAGYKAMFIGGIRDPIMIGQLDNLVPMLKDRLHANFSFPFELEVQLYGKEEIVKGLGHAYAGQEQSYGNREVGVLGKILAETQEKATTVAQLAKTYFIHAPYPGQVATAGNFMMPLSPCHMALGPGSEFCLYHLMQVDDPSELFPAEVKLLAGAGTAKLRDGYYKSGNVLKSTERTTHNNAALFGAMEPPQLNPPPPPGFVYLASLATVVRSKNAGPYELTLDIMFPDKERYDLVKSAGVLSKKSIMSMYGVEKPEHLLACMWWEPALAFKATIKRPVVSGNFSDNDVHGSGAHVPLLYLTIPTSISSVKGAIPGFGFLGVAAGLDIVRSWWSGFHLM